MVEVLDNLPANQQLQICGIIAKACSNQSNLLALPAPQTDNTTKVFQCRVIEEEEVLFATSLEKVSIGGIEDCMNIILDTGSSRNLIGRHLVPLLIQRMVEAGLKPPKPLPAQKKFQFGGQSSAISTERVMVPLKLGKTVVEA